MQINNILFFFIQSSFFLHKFGNKPLIKNKMKKAYILIAAMVLVSLGNTGISSAQDWPHFRGPARDNRVTGFKAPAAWPQNLTMVWKVDVGTGDASPVLSGGKLFLNTRQGDEEAVLCLDASSGSQLWRYSYRTDAVTGPAASHPGPRGTPSLAEGKLVTFGATGIISCLDASSGKLIWKKDNTAGNVPQFFTGLSPLVEDGKCFVHTGSAGKGKVTAYDLATGNEKWVYVTEGPSYATPSVMNIQGRKQLVVMTEKSMLALDLNEGKLLWQIPAAPAQRFYNSVSPVVDGNRIFFTGQGTGTKAIEVSLQNGSYTTRELWSNNETGSKWNTPVLKDGSLYGFSDQRRIFCIDAASGKTNWTDNATTSDFSTLLDCGTVLTGSTSTGNLIVFKPDRTKFSGVISYKVADTPVYSYPVIAGNNIFVKDAGSLMLYRIN